MQVLLLSFERDAVNQRGTDFFMCRDDEPQAPSFTMLHDKTSDETYLSRELQGHISHTCHIIYV